MGSSDWIPSPSTKPSLVPVVAGWPRFTGRRVARCLHRVQPRIPWTTAPTLGIVLDPVRRSFRRPPPPRRLLTLAAVVAVTIGLATAVVALLESPAIGLGDASPVYFVAVVIIGSLFGTWPAIATALGSFLVYDLLFTQPTFTVVVSNPQEWLDLVLFLVLAVIVGQLSALGRDRAEEASRRAAEATALFAISRILATEQEVEAAAPLVAERLAAMPGLDRVWLVRDRPGGPPQVVADTSPGAPLPVSAFVTTLVRMPGDTPARWVVAHEPGPKTARGAGTLILRVRMEADEIAVGSLKAIPASGAREPDRATTRVLALAADQLALAIRRDDLRREATELEIARRADAVKSALLDAVSHDLRTPLASIRAAAGSLLDPEVAVDEASARATAAEIDTEAQRLDRLVREVLDLSRIEAGSLRLDLEPLVLADAVGAVVDRLRPLLGERPISVEVPDELPPVRADAVLLDGLLTNLVENVARHAPAPAPLAISAHAADDRRTVRLTIDDGGPGLVPALRERLFAKFQPLPSGTSQGSRPGLGLGLAIVRGMVEAMHGSVTADDSPLGGLRITLELPATGAAPIEPEPAAAESAERTPLPPIRAAAPGPTLPVNR
jgi:two-component system, OmpR family, sensor histidine kinase KdpD